MQIKGLSHITLICKNLEKTSHMLKEVFGAKEIYSSGEKTFSVAQEKFFIVADMWVAIMQGASIEKTYNHIALQINEIDLPKFVAKITELDLEILPSRKREFEEGKSLYFYDYDNHLFELHTGKLETRLNYYTNSRKNPQ